MPPKDDRDHDEQEKHELPKKPNPRRLFSFDSIKSSNSSSRSSSEHEAKVKFRIPLNPFELSDVQEGHNETRDQVILVEEPISDNSSIISSPADRAQPSTRLEPSTRPTSTSSRSSTLDSAPSVPSTKTRARWENIRQHVLPGRVHPPNPPQNQTSLFSLSSRSSTPKPSGLARLGFRQVVEQTREVGVDTRRFGKEILKACAVARYAEVSRSTKDRDGQISTTSLSGTFASASAAAAGKKTEYFPQSIAASLTSPVVSSSSGSPIAPSLKPLYHLLIYHARPSAETGERTLVHLPHESHALGTLLCPFLTPSKYPFVKQEEEKATAMEAFELILRIWAPVDEVSYCSNIMKIVLTDIHPVSDSRTLLVVY